ncbi:DUF2065 domain-containing protein [Falsiroseomonas tokyonensis]|uniref:DUF2065 domain-containing protein n=1 Tax=Falsiroseomonas tokyonensis TaxID=430521 RepID=A0ABV7BWE5_9PROT|nr:DUF2065 domain-containing protein [Falsiroseomonas tokyonensis]MBU8538814.1 DUF2065 domain-containing protein [Falsiroseomonas tokyonensis]
MLSFSHVLAGVAVVLAVEGLCYALFPAAMKRLVANVLAVPEQRLRQSGVLAAMIGVAAAWLIVSL